MSCMGPISAALKSCVNPFDRSMYVATILQAWQTCSSSPLSIVVYLLLVLVAAPAHAEWDTGNTGTGWYQFPGPRNFFDVKRAQTFWSELRTREQLDTYIAKNCPKDGPYDAWKQDYNDDHAKAMGAVKSDPNAAKIMACHDPQVAIYCWRNLYVKIMKKSEKRRV